MRSFCRFSALWLLGALLACSANASGTAAALLVSPDGHWVIDTHAKLQWPRCVEGMHWNGKTCAGDAKMVTYTEARTLARQHSEADGAHWRVPKEVELRRLFQRMSQARQDAQTVFPGSPAGWHWSANVSIDTQPVNQYNYKNIEQGVNSDNINRLAYLHGWAVNLETGESRGDVPKQERLPLRLVRPWVTTPNNIPPSP
ncbi:MAG: DUF1566 domain-containing protein [Burkholderiales bacterium]|nr:DUF1566 domain-containing protein [Burkholderiales bacterium]MDE2078403.1 DUF1566 domain-containing protein [Burkholderiales bacterium]MDE2434041.1 DUF1566 domain-containing protein [Burkholderiales bacterium]